ncbi:MAG TPA: TonB-dependent receptor plug domain-containing protein, partial [Steroidobacteraceae bacterium]|nr:TonB-dependent receptor plug domain-containing protein [Steroidobacteraceae bacterium]
MNAMRFTRRAALPFARLGTLGGSMTALALITTATAAYAQDSVIGEVVVTAQKRSEQLLDIPMSVSVLGGESLERAQADNFQDLVALVPGLSINTSTRGISR